MTVIANTNCGKIKGLKVKDLSDKESVFRFTGIPFAKPPVAELRFKAPVEHEPWEGIKDATEYGPVSIQPLDEGESASEGPQSEDCLTLNVWTQGLDDSKKRPVMVWVHGGGYCFGGAHDALYDGTLFAERGDVVLVTIQYRLSALGFLYLDEIGGEEYSSSKNNAILDQVAALKWVNKNIENFGGDPDNVTIFGESVGGTSVATLMVTPSAKGLIHKVIDESGTFHNARTHKKRGPHYRDVFLKTCGVKDMKGLLALTEDQIRDAIDTICEQETFMADRMFMPTFDGDVLPEDPYEYIAEGNTSDILLMHGSTTDEYHYWLNYYAESMRNSPREAMMGLYKHVYRLSDAEIDELYQCHADYSPDKSASDIYIDMATWGHFRTTHARLSAAQSQQGPTWEYLFEWSSPVEPEMGSYHAIELAFVFNTKDDEMFGGNPPIALIEQIQDTWINFARHGNPNHAGLPEWPQYNEKDKPKMVFNDKPRVENDPDGVLREKWNEVMV